MDASLEDLTLRFEVDVTAACSFCEKIICGDQFNSLTDFINYHRSLSPPNCCTYSWKTLTVVAVCKECMKNKDSCICLDCFLKGNHKGHNVSFVLSSVGHCDCGDAASWSPHGFCSNHYNHKCEDLPTDLSDFLITSFTAALSNFQFLATYKTEQFLEICKWIKKFSDINDSFKSVVATVFSEKIDLSMFLLNFHSYTIPSIMSALDLISSLTSNSRINKAITQSTFSILPNFMWMFFTAASEPQPKKKPMEQLIYLLKILPYGFMHGNVTEMFNNDYDWVTSVSKTIQLILQFCTRDYNSKIYERTRCERIFTSINDLVSDATECPSQTENVKRFSSNFFKDLALIEGQCKFERKFDQKEDDLLKKETTSIHLEFCLSDIIRKICNVEEFEEENCINSILSFLENNIFNESFDENKEKSILFRSTLSPGVFGTESLALHIAFMQLLMKKKDKFDFMNYLYNNSKRTISFDDFLLSFSLLPIRLFAVHTQSAFGMFAHNSDSFALAIQSFTFKGNIILRLMPLFGLIQMMLGMVADKEYAANSILNIIGVFELENNKSGSKEFNELILFFLFFLSNIVTDRICMNLDLREFEKRSLALALEQKHLTVTQIENSYWPELVGAPFFKSVVSEIAEKYVAENETKYKLKNESFWIPIAPFISINSFFSSITPFIQKKKEQLLPFPDLPEDEKEANEGLNLRGLLMTRTTFAVIFYILSLNAHSPGSNIVSLHLALNMLMLMKKISPDISPFAIGNENDDEALEVNNLNDLIENMPNDFNTMLTFKIKYKKRPPGSLVDILKHLGSIGAHVFSFLFPKSSSNSSFDIKKGISEEESERIKKKKAAAIAKENALKQLQTTNSFKFDDIEEEYDDDDENESISKNQKKKKRNFITKSGFNEEEEYEDQEEEEEDCSESNSCTVCHEVKNDEIVWFPMTVFQSCIANFESPTSCPITDISASICTHVVHSTCIKNIRPGRNFQCSSDRCIKNCLLPKLPSIKSMINRCKKAKTNLSNLFQNEISQFTQFFGSVSHFSDDVRKKKNRSFSFSSLFELFIGSLTSIEFRDRVNPSFAKKQTNVLLLRYLFRAIWLIKQSNGHEISEKSMPIWILVSKLASSEKPSASIDTFASIIKKLLNGSELLKFERQTAILKFCVFNSMGQMSQVDIPNPSSLRKKINESIEFPKMFFEFILPKYNSIPVDKYSLEIGLCLVSGSLVYLRKDPETPSCAVSLDDHLEKCGGLCPVLMLTGGNATSVILYTKTFRTNVKLRPFYLTENGDENIGLDSSGMPLFFRNDVYEKMLDLVFSGEWLWSLDAKDHIDCSYDNESDGDVEFVAENNDL